MDTKYFEDYYSDDEDDEVSEGESDGDEEDEDEVSHFIETAGGKRLTATFLALRSFSDKLFCSEIRKRKGRPAWSSKEKE